MDTVELPKKKKNPFAWILWWQLDEDELIKQVTQYDSLKWYNSARGGSVILLLLSAVITVIYIFVTNMDLFALIDPVISLIFVLFIFKKKRWAIVGAMIYWTLEKAIMIFSGDSSAVISFFWWTTYMHMFYLAFKVENAHREFLKNSATMTTTPPPIVPIK